MNFLEVGSGKLSSIMLRLKPLHIMSTKDNTSDGARFGIWIIFVYYLKLFINLMDIENNHGPLRISGLKAKNN